MLTFAELILELFFAGKLPALSIHQPLVFCNLHLKPGLDIEQHIVLLALVFYVSAQARQLFLHRCHLHLEGLELHGIPCLCVR